MLITSKLDLVILNHIANLIPQHLLLRINTSTIFLYLLISVFTFFPNPFKHPSVAKIWITNLETLFACWALLLPKLQTISLLPKTWSTLMIKPDTILYFYFKFSINSPTISTWIHLPNSTFVKFVHKYSPLRHSSSKTTFHSWSTCELYWQKNVFYYNNHPTYYRSIYLYL